MTAISNGFGDFHRPGNGRDLSQSRFYGTLVATLRTLCFGRVCGRNFTRSILLNHPTQSLTDFVSRDFDLIIMRRPRSLVERLQLTGNSRCMAKNSGEFVFEFLSFRIHACLLSGVPSNLALRRLTHFHTFLTLTSKNQQFTRKP